MRTLTKRLIITTGFIFLATIWINAQSTTPPANFKPHGTNSTNTVVASENIDSVAVGAVLNYWVYPSGIATGSSTWNWTIPSGSATVTSAAGQNATITFPASIGTGSIKAQETTVCQDPTGFSINYEVIDLPKAGFSDASLTTNIALCNFTTAQTLNFALTTSIKGSPTGEDMRVTYQVFKGAVQVGSDHQVTLKNSVTSISIPLVEFGAISAATYHVILTKVDDRISRKSTQIGTINAGKGDYTIVVLPTPVTGPIYHLPNM